MWKLLTLCIIVGVMNSEGARPRKRYAGGYAGGSGSSYAGSYAGGGSDYDDYDGSYAPNYGFGFIDPYTFHQQLTAQILAQQAATQQAISSTYTTGDGSASAYAYTFNYPHNYNLYPAYGYDQIQQQIAFDQRFGNAGHSGGAYAGGAYGGGAYSGNKGFKTNRYAPNYAVASGSIGPGGYHQTAYISPENPAVPNIQNRFGASSPGGYKGVSVSSYSSSSDVNGQRQSHRGAQTTINDNGKVTTYKVHS